MFKFELEQEIRVIANGTRSKIKARAEYSNPKENNLYFVEKFNVWMKEDSLTAL